MICELDQKALLRIFDETNPPENFPKLVIELVPDLESQAVPSRSPKAFALKARLKTRNGETLGEILKFYTYKRNNFSLSIFQGETLEFLERLYQLCPSQLTFEATLKNFLAGKKLAQNARKG